MSVEDVPQDEVIEELDVVESDQPKLELEQPQSEESPTLEREGCHSKGTYHYPA